ncbi:MULTISPECIES: YjbH domain-containing protein [unclassified Pseudoalteromonas]|uniref:YjbH domain-containing protein n=1 Tax=unclassified Pseudoalteromonas TaxID=194690 RepID=UPI002097C9DD|nr:YjbH domain-containing protein [Pseudoalteromonas sp. XMcav2-N]MCO7188759.1 YjbH domain-containing protein [Pseudoalteromonas sp. XMcav2-N]
MSKQSLILASSSAIFSLSVCANEPPTVYESFAGYSGVINTPNAEVKPRGNIGVSYNNQLDMRGDRYEDGYNYIFSAGIWENLEVSGMIAASSMHDNMFSQRVMGEDPLRDLSFNLKYAIPLIPKDWFSLAVGSKDVGGASNKYKTHYIAASKALNNFRFTLGAASSERATGQMDGMFAGVEWQLFPWLALQSEYDAEAFNTAVRVSVPKEWIFNTGELTFTGKIHSDTDHSAKDTYWGVSYSLPLSSQNRSQYQDIEPAPFVAPPTPRAERAQPKATHGQVVAEKTKTKTHSATPSERASEEPKLLNDSLRALRNALIEDGFESVSIGFNHHPHIVIHFENSVFNRNDLDALGLVLGRAVEHINLKDAQVSVQLKKHDIPLLAVVTQLESYRQFVATGASPSLRVNQGKLEPVPAIAWIETSANNSPYLKPRLTLGPALSSTYATELGVYDFSLALRADLEVPLWKGAGVNITAQTVVADTDDFEPNDTFEGRREQNGLERAVFYQTFDLPFGFYNQTQIGIFREYYDYNAIINETAWVSPSGRHKIYNNYGYFDYADYDADREYHVVGYQYHWVEQDITFHASGGEFWRKDKGLKLETKFWIGDSYISLFAYDTDVRVAGISFSIPLTSRKDMNVTQYGQVKGNQAWRHSVGTRISEDHNKLVYKKAYIPETSISLDRTYFNQGRMSSSYVYANLARLREAYLSFK